MIITRVRAPVYRRILTPRELFKTTDIRAKEDVNRNQHIHNLKERRKEVWVEQKTRFERNFEYRVKKHVNINRALIRDVQNEKIAEKQVECLKARMMKRLNVV